MSKNTVLKIIGILSILSVGGGYAYYLMNSNNTNTNSNTNNSVVGKIFSPFGFGSKNNTNNQDTPTDTLGDTIKTIVEGIKINSKFTQITDYPVSGLTYFIDERPLDQKTEEIKTETTQTPETKTSTNKNTKDIKKIVLPTTEKVPSIRYMRANNGHVYQTYLDTQANGKISNSTIPEIYEGIFASKPNNIIYRLLGDDSTTIKTIYGTLGGKEGVFLPDNISDILISPNGNNFFYLLPNSNGSMGVVGSFVDKNKTTLLNSTFSEWLSQWPTNQTIFLTTKASYDAEGYMYVLPTTKGSLKKVLGGIKGLTTLVSPSGDKVLYSSTTDQGPRLYIYTISRQTTTPLSLYGLPEKCVWSWDSIRVYCAIPNTIDGNSYPDLWYQGVTSFTDKFVRINSEINTTGEIANSSYEKPIDGIKLIVDDTEKTLFFINKKDKTLWSLNLQ